MEKVNLIPQAPELEEIYTRYANDMLEMKKAFDQAIRNREMAYRQELQRWREDHLRPSDAEPGRTESGTLPRKDDDGETINTD